MNITLLTTAIAAALAGAAGFGLAWQLQAGNISELELNHANERIAVQTSIATALEENTRQIAAAQAASTKRTVRIRADVRAAGDAGNGLRLTTATTLRAAAESTDTCPVATAAIAAVFDQCVGELQTLAERADGHVSDIQTLTESWPK